MRVAIFLIQTLADSLKADAERSRSIEQSWRTRYEAFEESLPEASERTAEQWEELVRLTGELYYAIAASGNDSSVARRVAALLEAAQEAK